MYLAARDNLCAKLLDALHSNRVGGSNLCAIHITKAPTQPGQLPHPGSTAGSY